MTSDKAKKIKAIVKGTAPKSTFGTNPNDPWSAKYNVAESNDLDRYLKSRGINPAFVSKDTKIAHSKSGEFAKWKRDHQFEEVQLEEMHTFEIGHSRRGGGRMEYHDIEASNAKHAIEQMKSKLKPNHEISQVFNKNKGTFHHSETGRKMKNQFEEEIQVEQTATTRHTPTEIRQHELKKRVHKHDEIGVVKSEAWDQPDYNQSIKVRQAEADKKAKEQSKEGVKKLLNKYYTHNKKEHHVEEVELEEGKMGDLAGEIGRHLDKHIDDYKTHGGAEHLGYKTIDTAKKIVKSHNLHPTHAQKFVNDYVEKRLAEDLGTMAGAAALGSAAAYGIGHLAGKMIDRFHKKYDGSARTSKKPLDKKYKDQLAKEDIWSGVTKAYPETKPKDAAKEKQIRAAKDSAILDAIRAKEAKEKKLKGEETYVCPVCGCTPCNCTHISEDKFGVKTPSLEQIAKKHNVSMEELKKAHEEGIKVEIEHTKDKELASEIARDHLNEKPDYYKKLKKYVEQFDSMVEDVFQDSQAATQTSFDMGTSPDDTVQNRKKQLSKSARMVKALYKKHKMSEDIYDAEKEDKSVATYGKKPKLTKNDNDVSGEPDAVAVMSGGKTLTGEPRDDVEIDPMMKTRPNGNDLDKKKDKQ